MTTTVPNHQHQQHQKGFVSTWQNPKPLLDLSSNTVTTSSASAYDFASAFNPTPNSTHTTATTPHLHSIDALESLLSTPGVTKHAASHQFGWAGSDDNASSPDDDGKSAIDKPWSFLEGGPLDTLNQHSFSDPTTTPLISFDLANQRSHSTSHGQPLNPYTSAQFLETFNDDNLACLLSPSEGLGTSQHLSNANVSRPQQAHHHQFQQMHHTHDPSCFLAANFGNSAVSSVAPTFSLASLCNTSSYQTEVGEDSTGFAPYLTPLVVGETEVVNGRTLDSTTVTATTAKSKPPVTAPLKRASAATDDSEGCDDSDTLPPYLQKPKRKTRVPRNDQRERPHVCTFAGCGKRYIKRSHLKCHMLSHTNERPYACTHPGCQWAFARADELKRHARSHTNNRPYACDLCEMRFRRSDHLNAHKKTHLKKGASGSAAAANSTGRTKRKYRRRQKQQEQEHEQDDVPSLSPSAVSEAVYCSPLLEALRSENEEIIHSSAAQSPLFSSDSSTSSYDSEF